MSTLDAALKNKILNKEYHGPLIRQVNTVVRTANIPSAMVYRSMKEFCSDEEIEYFRHYKLHPHHGIYGLAYVGVKGKKCPVSTRMMAMTAAFVRNYLDARMMPVGTVIDTVKHDGSPECTVLLIPDFHLTRATGGSSLPDWQVGHLVEMLLDRQGANQQTVVSVESMENLERDYGSVIKDHIQHYFTKITV